MFPRPVEMSPNRGAKPDARRAGIQSIEIGSRILDVLAQSSSALGLKDVAQRSGMAASKVHRYMVSFTRSGLVQQDSITSRYDLGPLALRMGLVALRRRDVVRLANKALIDLNAQFDVTVILTIWAAHGPTVIGMSNGSELLIGNVTVGSVLPLLGSASGRVFLSFLPRSITKDLIEKELRGAFSSRPGSRVQSHEDVERVIAETLEEGFGRTRDELVPGLSAIAAPIFDHDGKLVASIAVLCVSNTIRNSRLPNPIIGALRRTALEVSERLGFLANSHDEKEKQPEKNVGSKRIPRSERIGS